MLEKIPHFIGHALKNVKPGMEKTVYFSPSFAGVPEVIVVSSAAFEQGAPMDAVYTEDGRKISPPLAWKGVPEEAAALILIAEDPDSPTPTPFVHALVLSLQPKDGAIGEAALPSPGMEGEGFIMGLNMMHKTQYLPPDPPPGHGPHRYMFQLYALDVRPEIREGASRTDATEAMSGHVIGKGCLIGTYERK